MSEGALTKFLGGGKVAAKTDRKALMEAIREDLDETGDAQRSGGNLFLNFSGKRGVYTLGKDKLDMDPEELYVVSPESLSRGWVHWNNSRVTKRHRWLLNEKQNKVEAEDLEDLPVTRATDGWKPERAFLARSLEEGSQIEFSTSTKSARNSVGDMLSEIADHEMDDAYIPVISFDKEEFVSHGETNWKPIFNIHAWVSEEQLIAFEKGDLEIDDLIDGTEAAEVVEVEEVEEPKKAPRKKKTTKRTVRPAL